MDQSSPRRHVNRRPMLQTAPSKRRSVKRAGKRSPRAGARAVVLPTVEPTHLAALNAFYRNRPPLEFPIAGEPAVMQAAWLPDQRADCTISLKIGKTAAALHVPRALLNHWLALADPAVDLDRIAGEHAALLLEMLLADALSWFEEKLSVAILLETAGEGGAAAMAPFGFVLRLGAVAYECALGFEDVAFAQTIGRLLDATAGEPEPPPDDLPVPVSLRHGAVVLTAGELSSLQHGDIVLTDFGDATTALLVIGDHLLASIVIEGRSGRLVGRPRHIKASGWEWMMNDTKSVGAGPALEDMKVDDLPVTLVFELGRATLPLGEVRRLGAGTIIPLEELKSEMVDLVANGKRIGRGDIVRIGESLGVRILELSRNA